MCPFGRLEDSVIAFQQMWDNKAILFLNLGIICSISSFNAFGVAVTKNASAAQRSTIDTSRTVLIWIFFLIYPGAGHEHFQWLQLIGFIVLVTGTLVYNEIVVLPFWGLDKDTKSARAARELEKDGLLPGGHAKKSLVNTTDNNTDYMALSPGAAYDANRNKRIINQKQHQSLDNTHDDHYEIGYDDNNNNRKH